MWLGRYKENLQEILANKALQPDGHAADFMGHSVANYFQLYINILMYLKTKTFSPNLSHQKETQRNVACTNLYYYLALTTIILKLITFILGANVIRFS